MNKGEVQSIVCNDSHVFLILKTGVVAVFCTIYLFEAKHLLNEDISGDETHFRGIYLESADFAFVRLNTTSIVFLDREEPDTNLCKREYWIGRKEAEIDQQETSKD